MTVCDTFVEDSLLSPYISFITLLKTTVTDSLAVKHLTVTSLKLGALISEFQHLSKLSNPICLLS